MYELAALAGFIVTKVLGRRTAERIAKRLDESRQLKDHPDGSSTVAE